MHFEFQSKALAQPENKVEDSSLLIEGEPGFKKTQVEKEEVEVEKPKISQGVEFYFTTMFNLLVTGGIILVIVGIYSATRKKK